MTGVMSHFGHWYQACTCSVKALDCAMLVYLRTQRHKNIVLHHRLVCHPHVLFHRVDDVLLNRGQALCHSISSDLIPLSIQLTQHGEPFKERCTSKNISYFVLRKFSTVLPWLVLQIWE